MADISKIELGNTIYNIKDIPSRNFVDNNVINVKSYGAHGDGINDDSVILQTIINNNPNKTLYFPSGIYLLDNPLSVKQVNNKLVSFLLDDYAVLKANDNMTSLIELGFDMSDGYYDRYFTNYKVLSIDGGIFDCDKVIQGIKIQSRLQLVNIRNCRFSNIKNYGIYIVRDTTNNVGSSNTKILNCHFMGLWSDTNTTAIYSEAGDNEIDQVVIDCCKVGIVSGGGDLISNVHVTVMFNPFIPLTSTMFNSTIGFHIKGTAFLTNCYADTCATGFLIDTNDNVSLTNCNTFYYTSVENCTINCVKCVTAYPQLLISNSNFLVANQGNNSYLSLNDRYAINHITCDNKIKLININTDKSSTVRDNDLIYSLQLNKETGITPYYLDSTLEANKFYPLCTLLKSNNYYEFTISNDGDMSYEIKLRYSDLPSFIETNKIYGYSTTYDLAIINEYTDNDNTYGILAIKPSANTSSNISLSNITNNNNINMLGHKYNSPVEITATSTIVSTTL